MTPTHPLDRLRVGMRAVVRHRLENGLTDALGEVVALDETSVSVATRRGLQVVQRAAVVAAKEVPPAPSRRGAPHLALSMADLERVMVDGWPPLERAELGSWMLRAASGFTGRANSVLPLGDPGRPLPDAVQAAEAWYVERGLRPMFSLFGPEGFTVTDDALGALLGARGYTDVNRSVVMTAAVASLVSATRRPSSEEGDGGDEGEAAVTVREGRAPWPQWWAASDERRRGSKDVAQAVMASSPDQVLLAAEVDGRTVATARVAFAHAWAGVFGLHVLPGSRRLGVATALMGAAAAEAQARGNASMYLQVERANAGAVALYRRLGCATHHEYVYLAAPEPPAT
jgi:ribosomal protein S18 acetylase RimI-like enzyme